MAFSRRNLVALIVLGLVGSCLLAQDNRRPSAATPYVQLSFRTFALEPIAGLHYRPRPNAARQPVTFYSSARSAVYRYDGPSPLGFYADVKTESVVAAIDVETIRASRALLLFYPTTATGDRQFEIMALPDDLERLPSGSAMVANLSGRSYRAWLNQQVLELPAGAGASAPVPIRERSALQLEVPTDEGWRRVTTVDLEFVERARAWIILFPPYRRGELQPQLRILHDLADPPLPRGSESSPAHR